MPAPSLAQVQESASFCSPDEEAANSLCGDPTDLSCKRSKSTVPTNLAKSIHDWIFLATETRTAGFLVPPHPEAQRSASGIRAFPVSI